MQLFHQFARCSSGTLSRALATSTLNASVNDKNWRHPNGNVAPISHARPTKINTLTGSEMHERLSHSSKPSANTSACALLSSSPTASASAPFSSVSTPVRGFSSSSRSSSSESSSAQENEKNNSKSRSNTIGLMALGGVATVVALASSSSSSSSSSSAAHDHCTSNQPSSSSSSSVSSSVLSSLVCPPVALAASAAPASDSLGSSAGSPLTFQLFNENSPTESKKKKEEPIQKLPLENPGKFDHLTRDVNFALMPQVFAGAKIQWVLPQFEPDNADKQLVLVGGLSLGDQMAGSNASLNVISNLGKSHEFRGGWDTNGGCTGRYKHRRGRWALKGEFQFNPMFNALALGADYRADAWTVQADVMNGKEISLSYVRALTRQLQGAVQLQHVLEQSSLLNWIVRYNEDEQNSFVLSDRLNAISLAYLRKVDKNLVLGTEFRLNKTDHESQTVVGVSYRRFSENFPVQSFTYQANFNTQGILSMILEMPVTPGISFGISGMLAHDGSNEAHFGMSLSIGQ